MLSLCSLWISPITASSVIFLTARSTAAMPMGMPTPISGSKSLSIWTALLREPS